MNAIINSSTFYATLNETRFFEFAKVLRDRCLCQADFHHQIPIDTGIGFDQVLKDGYSGRMGNSFSHLGNFILFLGE
jgi:hypothetical protein